MINKVIYTTEFKKDYKKLKKKHYSINKLHEAVDAISKCDSTLLKKYKDHALSGNWQGYRELHIEGNWLLIYKINNNDEIVLVLVRTGSHDKLF